jgi:hypothetical protein
MTSIATNKQVGLWEVAGVFFIVMVAGPMHELFTQSGDWQPLALIAPVNESIWEHQKMNFWPGLLFAGVQYLVIGKRIPNFWPGKLVGLIVAPILAVLTYILYIAVERASAEFAPNLIVTSLLSVLSVCVAQVLCYRVLTRAPLAQSFALITKAGFLLLIVAFSTLTYFPPKTFLFEHQHHYEPVGQYGIDVDPEEGPHPWNE